jgi:hypothetical protein
VLLGDVLEGHWFEGWGLYASDRVLAAMDWWELCELADAFLAGKTVRDA